MSDTTTDVSSSPAEASGGPSTARKARAGAGGLQGMLLPELKQIAGALGIRTTGLRKGQIVEAISATQDAHASRTAERSEKPDRAERSEKDAKPERAVKAERPGRTEPAETTARDESRPRSETTPEPEAKGAPDAPKRERLPEPHDRPDRTDRPDRPDRSERQDRQDRPNRSDQKPDQKADQGQPRGDKGDRSESGDQPRTGQGGQNNSGNQGNQGNQTGQGNQNGQAGQAGQGANRYDDEGGGRRNRRRRGRDRTGTANGGGTSNGPGGATAGGGTGGDRPNHAGTTATERRSNRGEPDLQILDDDVLTAAGGILDVLDNYAFLRTSGYLPGTDDVYVSMSMVRRYGLRRGDAITGQVRQPREGERKEKFNPLVTLDSVNGAEPDAARTRVEFSDLTPLHPTERLRLETTPTNLIGRVIDIAAPIGKGQRGLIVSPAKAGKTMILQSIAQSITTNNPECHLMVVLVDERPEEVTDFQRSVKGEVISSTFDRPASDHTMVAELAIERAKRLVELGHDVVVLLDGITRLGRAYNLATPASGRILSGGVDSAALYPPKRFFGAARNVEDGGSLTILATALVESGSKMDEVIFEEFIGTGNMELRLRSDLAEKRVFPAIDAVASGTRREEELLGKEELQIIGKLRRVLAGLDGHQALDLLLTRLRRTQTNLEFLMQVQKTTPTPEGVAD